MTYKQLRDDTLRLLNQYSVAGEEVSPTYNNQADYLKRLPSLLNDGQMLIATTLRPITEMMELKPYAATRMGNWLRFILPEDFYRPSGRGLAVVQGSECFRSHEFQLLGSAALLVPESLFGSVALEYYRYPVPFDTDAEDDDRADNTPDTHTLLPYYAAAHLAMHDDSFLYASLLNEFEARLERLRQPATAQRMSVRDYYGGFGYEG
ncbi:MAG: hypothetical protein IKL27_07900 [Oscillospiraceae bacterium]|nr:hypothetical protein [Oscillospiraceae bacterium]